MLMGMNLSQCASPALPENKAWSPPSGNKGVVSLGLPDIFWNKVLPVSVDHQLQDDMEHQRMCLVALPPKLEISPKPLCRRGSLFSS